MGHPPLPRSTTPCADQARSLPDLASPSKQTPTIPRSIQLESEEGTPTFGNVGLSSATPRRGGGDPAGKPERSQPEETRCTNSACDQRLEEHGWRPRPPGRHSTSWGSSGRRFKPCQPDAGQKHFRTKLWSLIGPRTPTRTPTVFGTSRAFSRTC